jgi:hypothetical protein
MQLIYEQAKYRINEVIKPNNKRSIGPNYLQGVLIDVVDSNVSLAYSTQRAYSAGLVCIYQNNLYVCICATAGGIFNPVCWTLINDGFNIQTEAGDNIEAENNDLIIIE